MDHQLAISKSTGPSLSLTNNATIIRKLFTIAGNMSLNTRTGKNHPLNIQPQAHQINRHPKTLTNSL